MNPQEIKLPTFPRYAQDEKTVVKFYSPFHAVVVTDKSIEIEVDEDYENTLLNWRKYLNDEFDRITESMFMDEYNETLKKLSSI